MRKRIYWLLPDVASALALLGQLQRQHRRLNHQG